MRAGMPRWSSELGVPGAHRLTNVLSPATLEEEAGEMPEGGRANVSDCWRRAESVAVFATRTVPTWCGLCEDAALRCGGLPSRSSFRDVASFACIHERRVMDQNIASWNQFSIWLHRVRGIKQNLTLPLL